MEESAELVAGEKPSSKDALRRWAKYKSRMKEAMEDHIKRGTLVPDDQHEVVSKPRYSFIHNREYGGGQRTTIYKFRPATILAWCEKNEHTPQNLFPSEQTPQSSKPHGNTERFAQYREEILGAAVYVLTHYPEHCRTKHGHFQATKIAKLIDEKSGLFWRDTGEPPLGMRKVVDLLGKWLKDRKKTTH